MKKLTQIFSTACVALGLTSAPAFADTIVQWTFETNTINSSSPAITGITPQTGTGTASGLHASAATDYSDPSGNGSTKSFNSNNWAIGDYYQFQLSTVGYEDIAVSFDQTSSNTGPRDFQFAYSTDGIAFTNFLAYSVLANASPNTPWNMTTFNPIYSFSVNLSSVSALDNELAVYFRLTDASTTSANGGVVGTAGTSRVDNFTVTGAAVPEPASYAMLLTVVGLLGFAARRRKQNLAE